MNKYDKIILLGMGGSAISGDIIQAAFADQLRVPLFVCRDYRLPAFIDERTLIILVSYSGQTEEVLCAAQHLGLAEHPSDLVHVVTTGGDLAHYASNYRFSLSQIMPELNVSGQPRTGLGYLLGAVLAVFDHCGALSFTDEAITQDMEAILSRHATIQADAFATAHLFEERPTTLLSAEFLTGATKACANMLLENSKLSAVTADIPEMNHNLLEEMLGRKYGDQAMRENVLVVDSAAYHPDNRYRLELTTTLLKERGFNTVGVEVQGDTRLQLVGELLWWGGFLSIAIANCFGADSQAIPWITEFKQQLAQRDLVM